MKEGAVILLACSGMATLALLALRAPAAAGRQGAVIACSVLLGIIGVAAIFFFMIVAIFAARGCLDYCSHEVGFWSFHRAGRVALGAVSVIAAAWSLRYAARSEYSKAVVSGISAIGVVVALGLF